MNVLDEDLSHIYTPPQVIFPPKGMECGVFGDVDLFLEYLQRYEFLDVCTATMNPKILTNLPPIKRGIWGFANSPPPKGWRAAGNVHAKIYIGYCFEHTTNPDVFVGSWNCTFPTFVEIMIRVGFDQARVIQEYFNALWKALEPKKKTKTTKEQIP